jgi:DNA-binding MarR family transcriptional regulator
VRPLDSLIHEDSRLKLITALNECETCDFNFLLAITRLTRGNMTVHMRKLIDAEYVQETKEFLDRKPHTNYRLTTAGRAAYKQYMQEWKRLTDGRWVK